MKRPSPITADAIAHLLVGIGALLCILAMHCVAHAAPICEPPTPACAALLEVVRDDCEARPRSCRLHVDAYEAERQCRRVEKAARHNQAPVLLSIVTAYRESGFDRYAVSSAGAIGIMQIKPRWWCEHRHMNCDTALAGTAGLRELIDDYDLVTAVAYYRVGNAARRGVGHDAARGRIRLAERAKGMLTE